jgi:FkbM family methyltransferase
VTGYKLDNLTVITENNAIGKVVIAGFWESDVIAALLAGEPQKLIMFEPDNAFYAEVKANYADESSVEVCNATLSDKTGEADYFVFTPNRFSSLLKPKKLLKIYRKNSNDNVININVSTVQSVCEQEKILPSAGNILLLGLNCPPTILSDAAQTDHLSYFDVIIVRQPKQGLYETEQQQDALSTMLQDNKFNAVQELSHDPMYTQFVYARDHQGEKINALQTKVTAAESRNAEVAKQLAETESRSSQFESSATELNSNYSKLKAQCEELTETQKNKDTQIAELTAERDQQTQEHQANEQRAKRLNLQCEELKAYSAARQKSANLALKLQTKAQIDLDNLREKYQHKHINEQKLFALISELRTKLQQAAEYYYELQAKPPELNEVTQNQVEPSNIENYGAAHVEVLEKKTWPAKRKECSTQAKSVTPGKS